MLLTLTLAIGRIRAKERAKDLHLRHFSYQHFMHTALSEDSMQSKKWKDDAWLKKTSIQIVA